MLSSRSDQSLRASVPPGRVNRGHFAVKLLKCRSPGGRFCQLMSWYRSLLAGCLATLILASMPDAVAATFELSCSGTATFPRNSKLPATVNRMLITIDFDDRAVSGFGHPLTIITAWSDLIELAGSYRGAAGPVQIRGSINLISGRTKVWGSRGATGRGPLIFLWELMCKPL
jgi:hypothetical protein